jgi:hypothetical protein
LYGLKPIPSRIRVNQEHLRDLLKKREVPYQTEGGARLAFRGGSCTISYGESAVILPESEYRAVSRILDVNNELLQMPEKQKGRSR